MVPPHDVPLSPPDESAHLAELFACATVGVCEVSLDGRFLRVNGELCRIHGRTAAEMLSLTIADVTHPDDLAETMRHVRHVLRNGEGASFDKRYVRPGGEVVWVNSSLMRLDDPQGRPRSCVAVTIDLSVRKGGELALRASELRLRTVANLVPDLLWQNDPRGVVTWCNERWAAHTGQIIPLRAIGWLDVVHPDDRAEVRAQFLRSLSTGQRLCHECRIVGIDGKPRWFLLQAEPLRDEDGRIMQWFGAATNTHQQHLALENERSARQQVEQRVAERTAELELINAELAREITQRSEAEVHRSDLLRQLASAQEDEQRRIARDVHDQLGQTLTVLQLSLRRAYESAPPATVDHLVVVQRLAEQLGREMHQLTRRLRPAGLDDLGLHATLTQLLSDWSAQSGIEVDAQLQGLTNPRLLPDIETTLYRVVQESLTNVLRHAEARHVSVVVELHDGQAIAMIEDDGHGFDPGVHTKRLGIVGMRERIALLGGSLDLESTPGRGTTVIARIPVHPT